ncbi:TAF5-like RNA polymerase II, p300 CBP-associated factor (PCAF)-associated factor [Seminavis robusta]|uniref:TAF5-like RNA polymerase II, p300 CBP-associated factor (PCAF)-associated factor n=1 Tax=Seminavis robusta TaxID=568900 RepID=A0A9N8HH82_9STRA|nr:TAF5-like RNA polymerase II, p300 CBP-associated factor (PCAF)-associated factor [Seminavis robusta]|eukprot:Sro621_g176760.1 TAF5-like RNA polymerase II, p300 CBP-associated factor (PCAF)-associated factor (220) ;mRNA; r:23715-24374
MISKLFFFFLLLLVGLLKAVSALNIVLPGGSGALGKGLAAKLGRHHQVTILSRNAFLASAPNRVTEVFGWVGKSFLGKHPHVTIRDWDGGDLLDIVGCDWMGWQQDTLATADVVVNLVGGYTEQRTMATERIVRESISVNNRNALQVVVSPTEQDFARVSSPGAITAKKERVRLCESMVESNCLNSVCVRLDANRLEENCEKLKTIIDDYEASLAKQQQ